jgi:hypothetical protein
MHRWEDTIRWATENGCHELLEEIDSSEFHSVETPTTTAVGPTGGPMYRSWDFTEKQRPTFQQIAQSLHVLSSLLPYAEKPAPRATGRVANISDGRPRDITIPATTRVWVCFSCARQIPRQGPTRRSVLILRTNRGLYGNAKRRSRDRARCSSNCVPVHRVDEDRCANGLAFALSPELRSPPR